METIMITNQKTKEKKYFVEVNETKYEDYEERGYKRDRRLGISLQTESEIEEALSEIAPNIRGTLLIVIKNGQVIVDPHEDVLEKIERELC